LATFSTRWPTRREAWLLFAPCGFVVFTWAIFRLLEKLPSWLMHVTVGDLFGIGAYAMATALIESAFIWLILVLAAAILPQRLFRQHLISVGTALVLAAAAWAIVAHYSEQALRQMGPAKSVLWLGVILASLAVVVLLVLRSARAQALLAGLTDRLSLLMLVYAPLGVAGLVVVILRNVL